jgi:hypothetical protein
LGREGGKRAGERVKDGIGKKRRVGNGIGIWENGEDWKKKGSKKGIN